MPEKLLFKPNTLHCTKKDLISALENVKDDELILLSNNGNFFTIQEIVHDGDDVIIRSSQSEY